jgi:hypothetical protein
LSTTLTEENAMAAEANIGPGTHPQAAVTPAAIGNARRL